MLATVISNEVKKELQNHVIDNEMDDIIIWGPSSNGVYTSNSAFKWLMVESPSPNTHRANWS